MYLASQHRIPIHSSSHQRTRTRIQESPTLRHIIPEQPTPTINMPIHPIQYLVDPFPQIILRSLERVGELGGHDRSEDAGHSESRPGVSCGPVSVILGGDVAEGDVEPDS